MQLRDQVIIVTGGGHGIGRALCERFAREQPRGIVVADVDDAAAGEVAASIGGVAAHCDVSREEEVVRLVRDVESRFGRVDLFCANAGIAFTGGVEVPNEQWRRMLDVNFLSHVYAARAVLPGMLARGSGSILHTASAAGLLTEISSAPYAVAKHAVVAFAEWLSVVHGPQGLKVFCLCPQGVHTRMIAPRTPMTDMLRPSALSPEQVAESVVEGFASERFLILPHPEVAQYFLNKATDYDRWLGGMRRLRQQVFGVPSPTAPSNAGGLADQ